MLKYNPYLKYMSQLLGGIIKHCKFLLIFQSNVHISGFLLGAFGSGHLVHILLLPPVSSHMF